MFEDYQQEFETLAKFVEEQLSSDASASAAAVGSKLREMERTLERMEMECRGLQPPRRTASQKKLTSLRATLDDLRHRSLLASLDSSTSDTARQRPPIDSSAEREKWRQQIDKMAEGSRRLEEARRMAAESEGVGEMTVGELRRQREQIQGIKANVGRVQANVDESEGMLKRMSRWWNRLI
ncbi:unnamed protein product [Vitrella brassicaformis CCMP3155]|uniref:Vesicle transport v-SNARE N-terminal domain-containing protein n=1 Tax=Vitrella brassicaformis (strain CCMP3155) TaxID=1169540 RepID=A0A0G4F5S2_VITBC|nr:unnamed protein product [Vitrella brassicaformis CCMP3155]|mmetsp:Transcript_31446/g.91201  ORF Transcript_31446/g.91201 Transcript_31446/m.91201 type:complete len:181 (-) Transcript_31446:10-552(-)|eukprot:CEM07550.1 unnamed protein product [Vitrella brassicaformis CCMP3155]